MSNLIVTYVPEKETKNTIKFKPETNDSRLDGAALYLDKNVVKEYNFGKGFKLTLEAK